MAISTQGVCFRNTSGYVTNPAGHVWCNWAASSYSSGLGVGMASTAGATSSDDSTTVPAVAGFSAFARAQIAQYDLPNGQYTLRLCSGRVTTGADANICIWDGGLKDGATQIQNSSLFQYAAGTPVIAGKYTIVGDKLYKCVGGGTTGASSPPSGTGASISDNTVVWQYIKTAIFSQFRASSGSVLVDAAGNTHTSYANWNTSNAEYGSPITIAAGFVQITSGQSSATGVLRYVGFTPVTTPLGDVALVDEEGISLGTTPPFHENQPSGKLLAKLNIPIGSPAPANFTVGGTLTSPSLGGVATTYFQLVQRPNTSELWLAATGIRLPADCVGTLTITQTDASSSVSGSPRTTTFNPTFVSANGRPTDTSALGLISSQCFNQHYLVQSKLDAAWAGFTGSETFYADVTAASPGALVAQMTTLHAQAASGRKFRIRLQNGVAGAWDSIYADHPSSTISPNNNITLPEVDFYKDGTGGLLIEPDSGHDPQINCMWTITALRGVEIRNCKVIGPYKKGNNSAVTKWLDGGLPTGSIYSIVIVRNNRVGLRFGGMSDAAILGTSDTSRTHFWPVTFTHGDLVRVVSNTFDGFENGINSGGVRVFESAYNDFRGMIADCHGTGPFSGAAEKKGVLADDHCYHSYHDNTVRDPNDTWTTANLTFATYLHPDFIQVRAPYVYGPSKATQLGAFALVSGNFYKCVVAGTTGPSSPPSGTGTGIVDGSVTWDYSSSRDSGPRYYASIHSNVINICGSSYFDEGGHRYAPGMQLLINSDKTSPAGFTIFNNISATKSSYGHFRTVASNLLPDYVELNSMVGPSNITDSAGGLYSNDVLTDSTVTASEGGTALRVRTYKNALGSVGAGIFDEDNLLISAMPSPIAAKAYENSFAGVFRHDGGGLASPNGFTEYDVAYDGSSTQAAFRSAMASQFTQDAAAAGYGAVTSTWVTPPAVGGAWRYTGLRLGLPHLGF